MHDAPTTGARVGASPLVTVAQRLVDKASAAGVLLRLCGGLACWVKCGDEARRFSLSAGRKYSDFDLAAYYSDRNKVVQLLEAAGFREELTTATVPGIRRAIFSSTEGDLHGDVSYDGLEFSHHIDFRGRLEVEYPTLPLAELLLQKLQIVELTAKDVVDIQMLLFDFDFVSTDQGGISVPRLCGLCGSNWGLYRTSSLNSTTVQAASESATYLDDSKRQRIHGQLQRLQQLLAEAPKSLHWRLRAIVGDRVRWYEMVERGEVKP